MHDLAVFLNEPLVMLALCVIGGGTMLLVIALAFTNEYERDGRESWHRRPRTLEPWHVEPVPDTKEPARHRVDTLGGSTTRLDPRAFGIPDSARSRVVMIGSEGIIDGNHEEQAARIRQSQKEDEQEEGSEDSERGQDEGGTFFDGEEGSPHEEAPGPVRNGPERWFRNTVTGEYVFLDAQGRRVDWSAQ